MQGNARRQWWGHCVFYQIYPRSFADGNHDGTGDLLGIIRKLDYLSWLGVEAIWLSPIYPSPMKDGGYDIQDYCNINPLFGDLEMFDRLVREAHHLGIRIVLDWVPNHTSDQHPWFAESRSSRGNPKRNWYIWRDQPNNWQSDLGGGSAWAHDDATGQYYLHSYLPEQPDLNWDNPEVRAAMMDVLRFWLDRGVDGFRCDVINMIAKDEAFADLQPDSVAADQAHVRNLAKVHAWLRQLRSALDTYPHQPVLIGELMLTDPATLRAYYGQEDELQLLLNLRFVETGWSIPVWKELIRQARQATSPNGRWPCTVLTTHDFPRIVNRCGGEEQARAAAVLLLALPGSPFIYAGDELGLANAPMSSLVDPGGRDGSRAPIPWDATANHGWPTPHPIPFPTNTETANYQREVNAKDSILELYRQLISLYKANPDLQTNYLRLLETTDPVLAFRRGQLEVAVNFSATSVPYHPNVSAQLVISSDNHETFSGTLGPNEAVILRAA